jgi:hypothetical protein
MIRSAERQTGTHLTPRARSLLLSTVEGNQDRLAADLLTGRMTVPKMRGAIIRLLNKVDEQENTKVGRRKRTPRRYARKYARKTYLNRLDTFFETPASAKAVAKVQLFCQFYPFCDPSKAKRK